MGWARKQSWAGVLPFNGTPSHRWRRAFLAGERVSDLSRILVKISRPKTQNQLIRAPVTA
jgi:hypothetical protein